MREFRRDLLRVVVSPDRVGLGSAAAADVAGCLCDLLAEPASRPRVVFAAAASQVEVLDYLASVGGIDWTRVEAFQLDEYLGLPVGDPRSLSRWLDEHIYQRVPLGRVEKMDGGGADPAAECTRFGELLSTGRLDLALLGIGESGHLAYNDPHVADFNDPKTVKLVDMDETSRHQAVRDGTFGRLDDVPRQAMTMTMSTILAARAIRVVVPDRRKARAVARALNGPIDATCPASALRLHQNAVLFLDEDAASLVAV